MKNKYQKYLNQTLPADCAHDVGLFWNTMSSALQKAGTAVCGTIRSGVRNHWISERTVALLQSRRKVPVNCQSNTYRRKIRRQVKRTVREDREDWWIKKAEEMEAADAKVIPAYPVYWPSKTHCQWNNQRSTRHIDFQQRKPTWPMGGALWRTIQSPTHCCPIGCSTYSRILDSEVESPFHFRDTRSYFKPQEPSSFWI